MGASSKIQCSKSSLGSEKWSFFPALCACSDCLSSFTHSDTAYPSPSADCNSSIPTTHNGNDSPETPNTTAPQTRATSLSLVERRTETSWELAASQAADKQDSRVVVSHWMVSCVPKSLNKRCHLSAEHFSDVEASRTANVNGSGIAKSRDSQLLADQHQNQKSWLTFTVEVTHKYG